MSSQGAEGLAEGPDPHAGPLPDAVRARVVTLAAEALGQMTADTLPASLKKVAAFAPHRRARVAGTQIASVIETDDMFREHLVAQLRADHEALMAALEAGTVPPAADPVDVAAAAYLLRVPGWRGRVDDAVGALERLQEADLSEQASHDVVRLEQRVATLLTELADQRSRATEQLAAAKAENAELRRRLGVARAELRTAQAAADALMATAATAQDRVDSLTAASDSEARRLRARIEALEREAAASRRTEKTSRDAETLRARLLLDTLIDAASGLRRELALPAVDGSPADVVAAHVAEEGSRVSTAHGSLAVGDPAMLDALLQLPRAHLIVDGYNVTKTAWPTLSLELQRDRLLRGLAPLAARSRAEVTVVFDAAETAERPVVNTPRGVRVLFSPRAIIADDVIRDLVAAEPRGRPLLVVTDDRAVVRDVAAAGARVVGTGALTGLVARV